MSYTQQPGCNCGTGETQIKTYADPNVGTGKAPTQVLQNGAGGQSPAGSGSLEPKPDYNTNRPAEVSPPANGAQPGPGPEAEGKGGPYDVKKGENGAFLEPPKLFNPKDRTARNTSIAPVRTAVYEQPVSYRQTSAAPRTPITAEQARQDAIGWTSGTN